MADLERAKWHRLMRAVGFRRERLANAGPVPDSEASQHLGVEIPRGGEDADAKAP